MRLNTLEDRAGRIESSSPTTEWWSLAIAVAVTAVIALLLPWGPDRVEVTITNPTDEVLYIQASTPDDDTLSAVTVISPGATAVDHEMLDRGEEWILHVRTLGAPAGTVEVSRSELVDGSYILPVSIAPAIDESDDEPAGDAGGRGGT